MNEIKHVVFCIYIKYFSCTSCMFTLYRIKQNYLDDNMINILYERQWAMIPLRNVKLLFAFANKSNILKAK